MHQATLEVLEGTGVEVHHDKALALLAAAGARVDGTRVRIPGELVQEALGTAPRSVTVTSRGAADPLRLESGAVYYGAGSDNIYVLGPGARERRSADSMLERVAERTRMLRQSEPSYRLEPDAARKLDLLVAQSR